MRHLYDHNRQSMETARAAVFLTAIRTIAHHWQRLRGSVADRGERHIKNHWRETG